MLEDDNGLKGIILFNETKKEIWRLWFKYKFSKLSLVESNGIEIIDAPILKFEKFSTNLPKVIGTTKLSINRDVYKIDIIKFVVYALQRGYDWKLYGQPEWEEIKPKKKKKFMKPKKR